jgi:hypothetical protein
MRLTSEERREVGAGGAPPGPEGRRQHRPERGR